MALPLLVLTALLVTQVPPIPSQPSSLPPSLLQHLLRPGLDTEGQLNVKKTRLRAAQHQATQAQTSAPAFTAPVTSVGKSTEQSAAQHREISKIKSKGGLDNRKTNYLSKDKQPKESSGIIFQCKVCKNSFQTSNDLNEHWELELYCKSCEKCIQGYYEGQSEHCLPDDEEHTTHEWQKVNNKCTKCVYVAKNNTGLQNHMKNKHDT